jgi:hypothetical protein
VLVHAWYPLKIGVIGIDDRRDRPDQPMEVHDRQSGDDFFAFRLLQLHRSVDPALWTDRMFSDDPVVRPQRLSCVAARARVSAGSGARRCGT